MGLIVRRGTFFEHECLGCELFVAVHGSPRHGTHTSADRIRYGNSGLDRQAADLFSYVKCLLDRWLGVGSGLVWSLL